MLKIENLTKKFGDKTVVDNLNLHIKPGEVYGFIGHNGAGKTTTLKSVVGLLDFNDGKITIDGKSIVDTPTECKKIFAYIPDNPDIYDYMTGIQFLNFIADIFQVEANIRDQLIHKYADMLQIESDLGQKISEYSHGMKQKLTIVSA